MHIDIHRHKQTQTYTYIGVLLAPHLKSYFIYVKTHIDIFGHTIIDIYIWTYRSIVGLYIQSYFINIRYIHRHRLIQTYADVYRHSSNVGLTSYVILY